MHERIVAALYVDPRGPYPRLPGVECWGLPERDAKAYAGPHPIVAHPPCGPWGSQKAWCSQDSGAALHAVADVRRWGGVLEHPAGSGLWAFLGLPPPGKCDAHGTTFEVEQVSWGHVARKRTWLYVCGVNPEAVRRGIRTGGTPTHWVSGRRERGRSSDGQLVPAGIKICSPQQRRRTPLLFAQWLVSLARQARPGAQAMPLERAAS